jgi:hypothetical protein
VGICLGAFLAGTGPGLGLLPKGIDTDGEINQPKSAVKGDEDTVIQVDWTFQSSVAGHRKGDVLKGRWAYFQDGVVITGLRGNSRNKVLARYTKSGDVAASLTPYGDGSVALIGIHPEATQLWCKSLLVPQCSLPVYLLGVAAAQGPPTRRFALACTSLSAQRQCTNEWRRNKQDGRIG